MKAAIEALGLNEPLTSTDQKTLNEYLVWRKRLDERYLSRTGITWEDGGGDEEEKAKYYHRGYSPEETVSDQISRYGLNDLEQ